MKTLLCLVVLAGVARADITDKRAVEIAERFVAAQGYTAAPPDRATFFPEMFDRVGEHHTLPEIYARRRNTLEPHAWGTFKMAGRAVLFRYVCRSDKQAEGTRAHGLARVVTMTATGDHVRIEHRSLSLVAPGTRPLHPKDDRACVVVAPPAP